jgi:hypothetical protein
MGTKGAGKSTATAAFHHQGHGVVTDDMLALFWENDSLLVSPGYPRLKLELDSAQFFDDAPTLDVEAPPSLVKYGYRATRGFLADPLPLKRVYLLEDAERAEVIPLPPREAVKELLSHWYGSQFGKPMIQALGPSTLLTHCTTLARHVTVCRLKRPRNFSDLPELVTLIEEDLSRG